jgi:hypothetical protein
MPFFGRILSLRESLVTLTHSPGDANHAKYLLGMFRVSSFAPSGRRIMAPPRAEGNRNSSFTYYAGIAHRFRTLFPSHQVYFVFAFPGYVSV